MPQYKVSLHNGEDPLRIAFHGGPVEAAHEWVDSYKPVKGCDIRVEDINGKKIMDLRVKVNIEYNYEFIKE